MAQIGVPMKVLVSAAGLAAAAAVFAPTAHAQPLPFDPIPDPGQAEHWAQDVAAAGGYTAGAQGPRAPYLSWLSVSRSQALAAATQAQASASAFDNALGAAANPAVVAANRNQLAALVATNYLGQNTPAIADPSGSRFVFDPVPEPKSER